MGEHAPGAIKAHYRFLISGAVKGKTMTLISIKNTSNGTAIIPARGGLGLVLGSGEEGTVCPEGLRGQGAFFDMVSRGQIAEQARLGRSARVVAFSHSTDDFDQAA
ncbi:MAG: hypothetical protein IH867_04355 [Chloroflexi bacterium]|nr:hypothetical protein [Chloroflexota bacterium]